MSHEERNVLIQILTTACILVPFGWLLVAGQSDGRFAGPQGHQAWAVLALQLIGASIALRVVLSVVLEIVWQRLTGEPAGPARDERDRAISGIGWKVAMIGTAVGFVGGVIALALGTGTITALNLMLAGCTLGDIGGNLARLRAYRQGA